MVRNCPVNCKVPEEQSWQQLGEHRLEPSENTGNISPVFVQIGTPPAPGQAGEAAAEIAVDPVCHMIVPKTGPGENNSESTNFRGQTYYFCHVNCLLKFNRNPKAYAKDNYFEEDDETVNLDVIKMPENGGGEADSINGTTIDTADGDGRGGEVKDPKAVEPSFTCPMHPEVLTKKPGPCPLCGMALESLDPTVSGEDDTELIDMENRLKWATPFTALAVLMNVPDMVGIPPDAFVPQVTPYLVSMAQLAVVTPVIWLARPFFERAADSIKNQSYNMFTLIATGVGISYFYSLVAILLPSLIPSGFGMRDPVHSGLQNVLPYTYFEPAAVIATLAMLGQVLELKARKQTGLAIRELMSLTPQHAHFVKVDDSEIDIALSKLAIDDKLRVRPGESVPVDGIVIDGRSSINESMITGETNLVDKSDGDTVIGGTINHAGAFVMQVKALGEDTLVARIVKLVVGAQRSRPPVQKAVDKIASYFVPAVIAASIITFVAWAYFGEAPALEKGLLSAISVLIIACPCALGLATPMSVMVAMGRGAKSGILVRDAEALDKLSEINTLVVDKTGTLTEGKPTVNKVITFGRFAEGQMMMLAAAAESLSEHPIGRAFVDHASLRGLAECHAHDFVYQPGGGVTATADGHQMVIGSQAFLFDKLPGERKYMQKVLDGSAEAIKALGEGGATIVMVVCDDELAACVAVSDKVRDSARATVDELKARGIKVHMLSGDLEPTARFVADQLGITDVAAGIGPTDKHAFIKKLQETPGTVVAMAGDGINDAPALAQADVGIAMGTGTNIAIDSAGIILVHGDLTAILRALNLSQAMKANIKQNLALAFGYNLLAVPIAAGVLYPFNHMLLDPMLASACMALSSLSVIANALRLRRTQI